jgi:DNA-binding response OmpR family regulator
MYRILLVEDDFALAEAMKKQLESWGNEVVCVNDFTDVMAEFFSVTPQLVLMDIMLPFFDGYHWCAQIRMVSNVPVVFISSASDNMNIVMAVNMGGDDFIAKPVDGMVLNAKVQAVLRRTYELGAQTSIIEFDGAVLNLNNGCVEYRGNLIELTRNEFRILQTLLENKGKIVSRDALMTRLWQDDCYVEENTLTVNVARLRKKLEENGLTDVIATKTGRGYIIELKGNS